MAIEPLYSRDVAAELIPMSASGLDKILARYAEKFPPRYQMEGQVGIRVLTESEVLAIRDIVIKNGQPGMKGRGVKKDPALKLFRGRSQEILNIQVYGR